LGYGRGERRSIVAGVTDGRGERRHAGRGHQARTRERHAGRGSGELQRTRLIDAVEHLAVEVGVSRLTVAAVTKQAGTSRQTFYDCFTDIEDCAVATFDRALDEARTALRDAYDARDGWLDGVRELLAALLSILDTEPGLARFCLIETLAGHPRLLRRRALLLRELGEQLEQVARDPERTIGPPGFTGEAVVGAVTSVLCGRLEGPASPRLLTLHGPLMSIIVLPYLGVAAADRERQVAPPAPAAGAADLPRARQAALAGLDIRVTHRTVRVLSVIAERPGASNRHIAERAGGLDEGQTSKLLRRLERKGLIANGPHAMTTNAWTLTPTGHALERQARPR
jgi:AcrR family transcriptional regulator